jgi:uncharacterized protein YunC (DUF1805 family)
MTNNLKQHLFLASKTIYKILGVVSLFYLTSCSGQSKESSAQSNNGVSIVTDTVVNTKLVHSQSSIHPSNLFTLADAEKILGEQAHLIDSTSKIKGEDSKYIDSMSIVKKDASIYSCGYMANSKNKKTGKTGVVYFGFEQYPQVSSAKKVYSFYKRANENAIGFKELHDIGDEAWFGSSPLFVYVRKGDKIFVIKVNKMTSRTSLNQFNSVANKIFETL